jgi:predicted Ser/Thr protein kinase
MMIVNRFIEISQQYSDQHVPLDRVFESAQLSESDHIAEAIHVIGEKRRVAGNPLHISEITSTIADLLSSKPVLDAAIDVCVDTLLEQGHSQDEAYEELLKATSRPGFAKGVQSASQEAALVETAVRKSGLLHKQLPVDFGEQRSGGQKRYELRRVIGSGAQGTIFEALDRELAEEGNPAMVAIKIAHEQADQQRLQLEAARARRVRHPNVAQVFDAGVSDSGEPYLVYELIDGLPLEKWIGQRSSRMTIKEACRLMNKIAQGVQAAHNAGVVHRDLKPSNIMMNSRGEPTITDFGIAHASIGDPKFSSSYGTRGSLAFMSPEQYHGGQDAVIPAVDTYALGGLLYWLITGSLPNGDTVAYAISRLDARNEGGSERSYDKSIDRRLVEIVNRALNVDLLERYASSGAFADDLDAFLSQRPIRWLDRDLGTLSALFVRRNPVATTLYFLVLALVAILVGVWVRGQGKIEHQRIAANAEFEMQEAEAEMEIERAQLTSQLVIEQNRVRQYEERQEMVRMLVNAWSQVTESRGDEILATSNLLFLYTLSTSGFLEDDPEMADKILNRRVEIAEEYIASLDPEATSPLLRAQWHEMLGVWYAHTGDERSEDHLTAALELVQQFAPDDHLWQLKITDIRSNAEKKSP